MRVILFNILFLLLVNPCFAEVLSIREFKGLNTKISSYDLPPEYATVCENARFDEVGSIQKRLSYTKYNPTTLGSNPIRFIDRIYIGDDKYLLASYDTTLKVGDDSDGTFSNLKTGLTAGLNFQGETYKGFYYLGNGTDDNIRTDGTSSGTKVMGCQIPASLPTSANTIGGFLDEEAHYIYKFAWVYDGYQISNGSEGLSIVLTDSDNAVQLYDFPAVPTDVTHLNIYRTKGDEDTFYYHSQHTKAEVEGYLTAARYKDITSDDDLGATVLHTDHDIPLNFKYIRAHKERLFTAGNSDYKSWIFYSDISNAISYPDIFDSSNYLPISEDDGDIITGLAIDPLGMLTVFKRNSIYNIYTEGSPVDWQVSPPFSKHGCSAPYSIAESPGGIIYLSRTGNKNEIRIFNGQTSTLISERIEPTLKNISGTYVEECVGKYADGKYFLSYPDSTTGTTTNNRELVIDLNRDAFSVNTKNIASYCVWEGEGDWGELYAGDSESGFVYREEATGEDIYHELKSELDEGAYTNCESSGTEAAPEVKLISADLSDSVGGKVANTLTTNAASTYSGEDDTAWPSGSLVSTPIQIEVRDKLIGLWTENLGSNGDITLQYRVGATSSDCESASWSDKYLSSGLEIESIAGEFYIQYQVRLYTDDTSIVTTPKLYVDSYAIWLNAGLNALAEATIPFVYETGDLSLDKPFLTKRFRSIRTRSTGADFTINYYLDGDTTSDGSFTITSDSQVDYFPLTAFGENIRLRLSDSTTDALKIRGLDLVYTLEPIRY